jgi:putative transposase
MPLYHVWFATKRRKWLLQGDIAAAVKELMLSIADQKGIDLIECETMVDHLHLLLRIDGDQELSRALNLLKGVCSRRLFQRFPELAMDAGTDRFWQHRFAAKTVSEGAAGIVSAYIRTQDQRLDNYER